MTAKYLQRAFLAASIFLLFSRLTASDNGIGVTLVSYTLDSAQNNIDLGYTLTIYADITNFDSVPFNGVINFGLRNSTSNLSNSGIFDKPPYSGDSIALGGHETVPAIFSVNINQPFFKPGPDVVVVWPIAQAPIADSITIHLNILDPPSGINSQDQPLLSYSIVNNTILLKFASLDVNFKQVRIFNVIGQKLQEMHSDFISCIPLAQSSTGIYLCQLIDANGRITTFKFILTEK